MLANDFLSTHPSSPNLSKLSVFLPTLPSTHLRTQLQLVNMRFALAIAVFIAATSAAPASKPKGTYLLLIHCVKGPG